MRGLHFLLLVLLFVWSSCNATNENEYSLLVTHYYDLCLVGCEKSVTGFYYYFNGIPQRQYALITGVLGVVFSVTGRYLDNLQIVQHNLQIG